jgi:hypothetical protein
MLVKLLITPPLAYNASNVAVSWAVFETLNIKFLKNAWQKNVNNKHTLLDERKQKNY